jgi:hypothetical protein
VKMVDSKGPYISDLRFPPHQRGGWIRFQLPFTGVPGRGYMCEIRLLDFYPSCIIKPVAAGRLWNCGLWKIAASRVHPRGLYHLHKQYP